MYEIEQKYRIKSPQKIRSVLKKLKAKKIASGFESNELLDRQSELRKKKSVLRLRRYQGKGILTYKGPRLKGKFKKRIEIETETDYDKAKKILESLGYKTFFRYTKNREEYHYAGCSIVLDHLSSLGWFLEIEGTVKSIGMVSKKLGLRKTDEEPLSYPQLLHLNIQ